MINTSKWYINSCLNSCVNNITFECLLGQKKIIVCLKAHGWLEKQCGMQIFFVVVVNSTLCVSSTLTCASTLAMEPKSAASTCRSIPLKMSSVRSTQGFPPNNISTAMSRNFFSLSVLWRSHLLILSDSTFTFNIYFPTKINLKHATTE